MLRNRSCVETRIYGLVLAWTSDNTAVNLPCAPHGTGTGLPETSNAPDAEPGGWTRRCSGHPGDHGHQVVLDCVRARLNAFGNRRMIEGQVPDSLSVLREADRSDGTKAASAGSLLFRVLAGGSHPPGSSASVD